MYQPSATWSSWLGHDSGSKSSALFWCRKESRILTLFCTKVEKQIPYLESLLTQQWISFCNYRRYFFFFTLTRRAMLGAKSYHGFNVWTSELDISLNGWSENRHCCCVEPICACGSSFDLCQLHKPPTALLTHANILDLKCWECMNIFWPFGYKDFTAFVCFGRSWNLKKNKNFIRTC